MIVYVCTDCDQESRDVDLCDSCGSDVEPANVPPLIETAVPNGAYL